ncbi:MAG: WD40 repeat domain-containing serine/threonine protein kinase [Oscillochloridaceae bacterium umkhey_bin13]
MLESGAILQDRYKIIAPIGKGGMGSVYRARDLRLRTDVALKETLFNDEVYRRAFEHEAQILARLRHQALPRVIDHFIEGPGQFLVMEFIHGEDLGNQLARLGTRFATAQAMPMILRWADQLLDALHYLHTRPSPVIHRDIKPKNLKLTQTYDIVLLDFGLARGGMTVMVDPSAPTDVDQRKVYGFTPPYAPIEQMRDSEPDPRSDLYSLGATIYHLLTATLPADAMTRMAKLVHQHPDPLRPITSLVNHVPMPIAAVFEHALQVMLDERPASAQAMRAELARARGMSQPRPHPGVAAPEPVPAPPPPAPPPVTAPPPSAVPASVTPSMHTPVVSSTPVGTLLRMLTTGSPIRSLAFSPSGELLAAGYEDHTVGMWRMSDYSHLATLRGHFSGVRSVRFAPKGGLLASGSDDETVRLWQVSDGAFVRQLRLPGCPIESLAFHPSGELLAVGGWGNSVTLCRVEADQVKVLDQLPCSFVHNLCFSPDGTLLAAGGYDGAVYLWRISDYQALEPLGSLPTFILAVGFSADGEYLAASCNNSVHIWRMSDQKPIEVLSGHNGPVHCLAFSPQAPIIATGSEDRTARLWDVRLGSQMPALLDHRAGIAGLCYSPDGTILATGTHDGRICLWRVAD